VTFNSLVIVAAFCKQLMDAADMFTFLLPPYSDHAMIHSGGYNCSVYTYSHVINWVWQIVQYYCNLPNESSHGLNWMATKV